MPEAGKTRIEYHIEEYGRLEDRTRFITAPAIWPRVEICLEIIERERTSLNKGLRVLDVGCSDGTVSRLIVEKGNDVSGIDVIPHLVEKAKQKGIKAILGDIEKGLPYDNESFDVVHAAVLLEHIFDTESFLKEVARVLRRRGLFVASVPNISTLPNRMRLLLGLYPRFVAPATSWRLGGHVRAFTLDALGKVLESTGFKLEQALGNYVSFLPASRTVRPWSRSLGRAFPTLSDVLIVSARRE